MDKYTIKSNIKDVQIWIENINNNFNVEEILRDICEKFIARVKVNLANNFNPYGIEYNITQFASDIKYEIKNKNSALIYAGDGATAQILYWLEYGTGIVGSTATKNPNQPSDYSHDTREFGDKGWWYNDPKRHKVRWTRGLLPIMFWYKAYIEFDKILEEVLK